MSKSLYSLILSDEVVAQIDRAAYRRGISRSALVNEILASSVSYVTPEMRTRQILRRLEEGLSDPEGLFLPVPAGGTVYAVRSRLVYKYNPSLRYSVELSGADLPEIGWLKVGLRSRSDQLTLLLLDFFRLWQSEEERYSPGIRYYLREDGRFERALTLRDGVDPDPAAIGDAIAAYVNVLNEAINGYFARLPDPQSAAALVRAVCAGYYREDGMKV